MNRPEALRILGLDEDATAEDIKTAYKEVAQILHPDRFASSKKLQDRATEQFKNLQEAYELLTSGKAARPSAGPSSRPTSGSRSGHTTARELEARLAGIAAAKTQLVAQRNTTLDERRNSLIMLLIGLAVCLLLRRIPIGLGLGTTAVVWGIVRTLTSITTLKTLDEHIKSLNEEKKKIARKLEEL
ncbi:MAG: J domain-containing protein [Eggerthellaceae bacterium]|nr:J domain-containing protein [Eggerthellaceae bacterium]